MYNRSVDWLVNWMTEWLGWLAWLETDKTHIRYTTIQHTHTHTQHLPHSLVRSLTHSFILNSSLDILADRGRWIIITIIILYTCGCCCCWYCDVFSMWNFCCRCRALLLFSFLLMKYISPVTTTITMFFICWFFMPLSLSHSHSFSMNVCVSCYSFISRTWSS